MSKSNNRRVSLAGILSIAIGFSAFAPVTATMAAGMSAADEGKKIAFDRKKGNCLACHMMADGEAPGNIAPPLVAMKARFPEKAKLKAQIWDAQKANPETVMPPFGSHKILSNAEIDKIVEYVWGL
jgi:sulfur-oxidizing protein SoxX